MLSASLKLGLVIGATGLLACATPASDPKPNVLLIISDDQGFGDFGFNGNTLVRTPCLDRLASESAVFRNFVVAPACSPTRAAIWTGRHHLVTGVWGVPPRANLRPDEIRMPAFFKAAGYRTLHVGKLDCVKAAGGGPSDFGWDEWLGGGAYEHRDPMMFQPTNSHRGQGWTVDLWTDRALEFIRSHRDDGPWFASVAYIIPHLPWVCDEKFSAPFLAKGCSKDLADCYGSIAQMDACIGRLLAGLEETGQEKRTIVVFVSDNGATGPDAKKDSPDGFVHGVDWEKRNVAGLRGHKATVWENGIRVPLLVRWPGKVAAGARAQFGCAEDLLPTVLGLAGVEAAPLPHLPFTGVSLEPALADPSRTFDRPGSLRLAIAGPGSPRDGIAEASSRKYGDHHLELRGPRFKYHALPGGKAALFDLQADPGEKQDVAAKFPEIAASMAAECRRQWDDVIASGRSFAPPEAEAPPRPKKQAAPSAPAAKAAPAAGPGVGNQGADVEPFDGELSKDWFWGLGTWMAKGGVLRGFESGPRRHGPVKMRRCAMRDGSVECEFRLEGKAGFAGIIFNGSQERGHIAHLVVGRDQVRMLAHPAKDKTVELVKQAAGMAAGTWHRARVEFKGDTMTATVDGRTLTATQACFAEPKESFGLGGDSGGPEGEKAGAIEFRGLRIAVP